MRRHLAVFNVAILLLTLLFPLLAPIAAQAVTNNTRFGMALWTPEYGSDGCYSDLFMLGGFAYGLHLNSDGYPDVVGVPASLEAVAGGGYPNGYYQFFGKGKFSVQIPPWPGVFKNFETHVDKVSGETITTGLISCGDGALVPPPGTYQGIVAYFFFTPTDAKDPPHDFHLIRPDMPAYYDGWEKKNSIFGKEFLAGLKPYCCIRFINWMLFEPVTPTGPYGKPPVYGVTTWASRPSPTYFNPAIRTVCYENMIELCNELNEDMWLNIPLWSLGPEPTDWCTQMALLIKQKLKPNLNVYFEVGDECWNYANPYWPQTTQVLAWAQTNPDLAFLASTPWNLEGGEAAVLLMRAQQRFSAVLGTNRTRAVLEGQFSSPGPIAAGLQYIEKYYGPPANFIYGIGWSFYIGNGNYSLVEPTMMSETISSVYNGVEPSLKLIKALADQYNLHVTMYEGGNSNVSTTCSDAVQQDPLMATAYYDLAAVLKAGGADLCCWYDFCGDGGWGQMYDIRQMNANPPGSIEWQATANIAKSCKCGTAPIKHLTAAQEKALEKAEAAAAKAAAEAKKHHH